MRKRIQPFSWQALLIFLLIAGGVQVFGQDVSQRDKLSVYLGPGWANEPSSSGFFGASSTVENHPAITGGAEFKPLSHLGFAFNTVHIRHKREFFNGTSFQTANGDTFISGDAVFHLLIRRRLSPFLFLGVAHEYEPNAGVSGLNLGAGATIRISPRISLRPEFRSYWVHLLSSDPTVVSMGIVFNR